MNGSPNPTFAIYQICFRPEQRRLLDPAFVPYENFDNERPEWREFHVFRKEWLAGTMDQQDYTGFFSWKFREKARIEGRALLDFARANPGADCYFINPFPVEIARFPNMWVHGEYSHSGLIAAADRLFHEVGTPRSLATAVHTSDVACYCNFWFATKQFWQAYMDFCLPIYEYVEHRASEEEKTVLWGRADRKTGSPMIPFIFERLFTEFLIDHPEFEVRPFRYSDAHLATRFHKRFPDHYKGADALKRVLARSPDPDLLCGIGAYGRTADALLNMARRKRRRDPRQLLRDAWDRWVGSPPRVLDP